MKINKLVCAWGLVITWMCVIFLFSAMPDTQSSESSLNIVSIILKILTILPVKFDIDWLHFMVRKAAHCTEYFILCLLCINAFRQSGISTVRSLIFGFLLSAGYAATDEFHQLFVPGRVGCISDVAIDSLGSAVAVLTYGIAQRIWNK